MKLRADQLLQGLNAVKHAVASDAGRPILTCILMEPAGEDAIYLTAADNYRIARARVVAEDPLPDRLCLHPDSLPLLLALLKPLKLTPIEVRQPDPLRLVLTGGTADVEVRLMDGTYPNVRSVTSQLDDTELSVVVNPKYLRQLAKLPEDGAGASIYIKDPLSPVRITIGSDYEEVIMPVRAAAWKRPARVIDADLRAAVQPVLAFAARMAAPGSVLGEEVAALITLLDPERQVHLHRRQTWDIEEDGRRRVVIVCPDHQPPVVLEVLEPEPDGPPRGLHNHVPNGEHWQDCPGCDADRREEAAPPPVGEAPEA